MSAAVHRAAVLSAPRRTSVATTALPQPGAGEERVRLQGCGICASNLAVWEGRPWFQYPRPPASPGHEGWGIVEALGSGVYDLAPGERVALISSNAYAEHDIAPRAAVVRLAPELDALPFPGEALGCAMNIFERSENRAAHRVAIVGAGFLGLLLTQLAARAGAEVVVLSRARASAVSSLQQLLELELDGVVIATPNAAHVSQTLACLERGLPVSCQKPLADSSFDAQVWEALPVARLIEETYQR